MSIMHVSFASNHAKINKNKGVFQPGVACSLPEKVRLAQIYISMQAKREGEGLKPPTVRAFSAEAHVSIGYAHKLMEEI